MTQQELAMEAAKLRLRLRMDSRLKLESQALLSRVFRDHDVPVRDELLSSLVFAVPNELMAEAYEASASNVKIPPPNPTRPPTRVHDKKTPPNPPPNPPPKRSGHDEEAPPNPPPKPPTKGGGGGRAALKPPPKPPTKR